MIYLYNGTFTEIRILVCVTFTIVLMEQLTPCTSKFYSGGKDVSVRK